MGPNGSGKSSLLNGILSHPKYALTSGRVMLDGEDITGLPTEEKARKGVFLSMQYVPEIPGVTLLNFLHRAHRARGVEEMSVLEYFKALEARAKEVGIDSSFLRRQVGSGLSGGEKKQAELLQMLAIKPKFALLDEIDSGVDIDARKRINAGIMKAREEGTGILFVTHYASILKELSPDRVTIMRDGKVVASGGAELAEKIAAEGFENI
jgi:Fe-S cluster assembly ATP-binding protein